jgi:preprotein translocase subunit YajC
MFISPAFAQASPFDSMWAQLLPIILIVAVGYFIMRRMDEKQKTY